MQRPTLNNLINDYTEILSSETIEGLKLFRKNQKSFSKSVQELKHILFDEEHLFYYDSISEYKERKREVNPMSKEYIQKVKQKRELFELTPLSKSGLPVDDSAEELCKEIIRLTGNYTEKIERKKHHLKEIIYVDMDNVLVDLQSGIDAITEEERQQYKDRLDEAPKIFSKMLPVKDAIDSFKWLVKHFEVYILSAAPCENPSAWSDKLIWVKKHLGNEAHKKLILSHHKNLLKGQFIIDDRTAHGVDKFDGKHIHFGTTNFENWEKVISYLKQF